jgi:hypothetical protein
LNGHLDAQSGKCTQCTGIDEVGSSGWRSEPDDILAMSISRSRDGDVIATIERSTAARTSNQSLARLLSRGLSW